MADGIERRRRRRPGSLAAVRVDVRVRVRVDVCARVRLGLRVCGRLEQLCIEPILPLGDQMLAEGEPQQVVIPLRAPMELHPVPREVPKVFASLSRRGGAQTLVVLGPPLATLRMRLRGHEPLKLAEAEKVVAHAGSALLRLEQRRDELLHEARMQQLGPVMMD